MFNLKLIFLLGVTATIAAVMAHDGLLGGLAPIHGRRLDESVEILKSSFAKWAAGGGPNYKVSRVTAAWLQIVAGFHYKYTAQLLINNTDLKECQINLYYLVSPPNTIEVLCKGGEKVAGTF